MRVMYAIPGAVFGGAHNQVLRLAPLVRARGMEPVVVLPDEVGDAAAALRAAGVETHSAPLVRLRATRDPGTHLRFATRVVPQVSTYVDLLRDLDAAVVQAHGVTQVDVVLAGRRAGVGVVWQLLDTRAPRSLCKVLAPALRRLPDVIMTTGEATLSHHLGSRAPSVPVVSYAPPVRPDIGVVDGLHRATVRASLGLRPDDVLVASIGNLNPQKGHETLVRAIGVMDRSRVHCQIRGSASPQHPDYRDQLLRLAREVGGPRLFVGPFDDRLQVPDLLAAADVFCLASEPRSEGLPTVILEAMRCGVPVVASDVGSVAEAVEDGVTGYLFPSRDAAALAGHLTRLAEDDALRSRMGTAARERAAADYTLERYVEANMHALTIARDAADARSGRGTLTRLP